MPLVDLDARRSYTRNYMREYDRKNPEKRRAREKAYRVKYPEKQKLKLRRQALRRKYGIELEVYDNLLVAQNGVCAICKGTQTNKDRPLVVDHSHITGEVRGLLCDGCNTKVGVLESPLKNAVEQYLQMPMMPGQNAPGGRAFGQPGPQ